MEPRLRSLVALVALLAPWPLRAAETVSDRPLDVVPGYPFKPGDVIDGSNAERIRDYLPPEYWKHRDFFFHEGMRLEIGALHADYSPSAERQALTTKYAGQARIGRDDSLESYSFGLPFPEIDLENDPQAGAKLAWNTDYKHDALEGQASWHFTYWDVGGEQLPLYYQGTAFAMRLAKRTDLAGDGGSVFPKEKRKGAGGIEVTAPFDVRGVLGMGYRYLAADGPREVARDEDVWVYLPDLRRVRRISAARRMDSISGTDFTPDDGRGFSGIVPQFSWKYVGKAEVLAPINTRRLGYPMDKNAKFGKSGISLVDDTWDLRKVYIIEQIPKEENHPYSRKTLWLDRESYNFLYAMAYDRKGNLWKIIQSAHRWSESEGQPDRIDGLRTFLPVCDIVANVQTGTGNRIEFWDARPTRLSKSKIRKLTDVGRLHRGH
jgi:outer membrane lipoprotein-sorting protein